VNNDANYCTPEILVDERKMTTMTGMFPFENIPENRKGPDTIRCTAISKGWRGNLTILGEQVKYGFGS
jgi:hypothetical protein